ncbi:hypothetical protein L1D34_01885 [Vibrio mediterranei]|uniref:hypothetical protein n=1 Tax=Vibrio mediterranei TaxID=689 RepID=UPI001EFE5B25|nr:hypothetical protein [Vibrio mediterranei]MCG9623600.1 hypothetical protein [Vibrio mediterranei]
MYKYINDIFDTEYNQSLPERVDFTESELPLEEIEVREMVEAWYLSGYAPCFEKHKSSLSSKFDELSFDTGESAARLKKLETTLMLVIKNQVYRAAFKRLMTTMKPSSSKARLKLLLKQVENDLKIH